MTAVTREHTISPQRVPLIPGYAAVIQLIPPGKGTNPAPVPMWAGQLRDAKDRPVSHPRYEGELEHPAPIVFGTADDAGRASVLDLLRDRADCIDRAADRHCETCMTPMVANQYRRCEDCRAETRT